MEKQQTFASAARNRKGKGRPPHELERMLRIYLRQPWSNRSDPQAEDASYDSESMRRFARVELGDDEIPGASTILRFRHLLAQHGLTEAIFEAVKDLLAEQRLTHLLHGQESAIDGDQAYWKEADRQEFEARGVRYRGLAENLAHAQAMFALANLYAARHRLPPPQARCVL